MATAAADSDPEDSESSHCSVCSEPYTDPKLLVCGHLLCRHCLLSWASSKKDALCPLCRSVMLDGAQGVSDAHFEKCVDGLPTDLAMKHLADAQRVLTKDHTCCVCVSVAASTICLTCRDMLCASCTRVHEKLSATKHHRVASLTSVTPEQLAAGEPSYCQAHAQEASRVFCTWHGAAICLVCAATEHKPCVVVTEEARAQEARAVLGQVSRQLSQGQAEIEKAMEELDAQQEQAQRGTERALQEGLQLCHRLDSLLHKGRQRLTHLAQEASSNSQLAAQKARALLLSRKGRLTTHRQAAARAGQLRSSADLTRMARALKERLTKQLDCSPGLPAGAHVAMTTLVLNTQLLASVERLLQQDLGQLNSQAPTPPGHSQLPQFSFHTNHGTDLVLRDGGLVAQKQGNLNVDGILMSSQPMEVNYLYEVEVRTVSGDAKDDMLILPGLVTEPPDQLTLPQYAFCWTSAIVVGYGKTSISGKQVESSFVKQLMNIAEGSRVGVSLDDKSNLLVHRDGRCLGTVAQSVQQPAYAMFELPTSWKFSVAALPPTYLK